MWLSPDKDKILCCKTQWKTKMDKSPKARWSVLCQTTALDAGLDPRGCVWHWHCHFGPFPTALLSSPQLGSFWFRSDLAGLGLTSTTLFPVDASHTGTVFPALYLQAAFWETGRDEHQHSWHGPQPQREQNRHPAFPQSHTPAVTLCYRMAAWPHPHGLAAERSDRESSQSRNPELCLHPSLELEGHSVSPNSLQKRSNLFASLQHEVSHAWFIPLLFQMFLLSSPVTPPPLTTNGWKHTVLTGTFCVWILWLLASGIIANFILLPSHWLCLPLSLQNLFSPQRLFSQDNRRKKNWIMKFPYISYEKYIKLTFSTSKDCNLSLAVLPLFPIAA